MTASITALIAFLGLATASFKPPLPATARALQACQSIATSIKGEVFYATSPSSNYKEALDHWLESASDVAACVVEVASSDDVAVVLQQVALFNTTFAVKCGGHATNPGASSTQGVQISLVRLKGTKLNEDKTIATIGAGALWTEVYKDLDGSGVNVAGGRLSGPGVAGFVLGGGFSWHTQQVGLTIDTVDSFDLVLPDGTIALVNSHSAELFFALKGGLNKFGIVTSFRLKTFRQSPIIYGGNRAYSKDKIPALIKAVEKIQRENEDPKVALILTLTGGAVANALVDCYYDGPEMPEVFRVLDELKPVFSNARLQPFLNFVLGSPTRFLGGHRGAFATLSTKKLTLGFMEAIREQSESLLTASLMRGGLLLTYDIEPFTEYGRFATDSAFGHKNSPLPLNLYFSWQHARDDAYWTNILEQSIVQLKQVAMAEGIHDPDYLSYPNYALSNTAPEELYGAAGTERLRFIRHIIDPDNVMGRTGGFNI